MIRLKNGGRSAWIVPMAVASFGPFKITKLKNTNNKQIVIPKSKKSNMDRAIWRAVSNEI